MKKWLFLLVAFQAPLVSWAQEDLPKNVIEHNTFFTIGTIYPLHKSVLGSTVSGKIEELFVDVGDSVKKGAPLLKIDPTLYEISFSQANANLHAAEIEGKNAAHDFERMKKLWEKPEGQAPAISQKKYEDAETRYEQSLVTIQKAKEEEKRAKKNLDETVIRAPYDGIITKRLVHPGESITATPVMHLVEMLYIDTVYIEFSVPQLHMNAIHVGTPIQLKIEGMKSDVLPATIDLIYPDMDEKTRSIKCRAKLDNHERVLHPGALVRVEILLK